jgi:hypothetical protein
MFEFNSDVQRNIYSLPFPKTEKEIAYDIYATYYNYILEPETYRNKIEAYPKYVEKNFKDSGLLSKIVSLLKDKETDKRKILIFIERKLICLPLHCYPRKEFVKHYTICKSIKCRTD